MEEATMILKTLRFWQNWFHREEPVTEPPAKSQDDTVSRRPPAAITVRAAMRQKQKLAKTSQS